MSDIKENRLASSDSTQKSCKMISCCYCGKPTNVKQEKPGQTASHWTCEMKCNPPEPYGFDPP